MQLARTTRLIFTFYKNFAFASLLATAICVFLFWEYGYTVIGGIFWFRLAVAAIIFYFINIYKEKEYYYYQNLGVSKKLLWITTTVFDFALFIFLLTQMTHKLEADGIQLSFDERRILSDIYLKCETEKITGLLGRNGHGKSCLMKIMYGSMACEKSVRVDNRSLPEAFKHPKLLAYLPQFNFIPASLPLKRIFKDFELAFSSFEKIFPEFSSAYTTSIAKLSGGGRRLIELYVIIKSPALFAMLDEPFSHISPVQIEKIKEILQEEKKTKGFLITDHLYQHITDISDSLYILANGKTHLAKELDDIERLGYARL